MKKPQTNTELPVITLRNVATKLYQHFHKIDEPNPADEIYVPVDLIKKDEEEEHSLFATVRFVTNYVERKVHSIRIKFKADTLGNPNTKTIQYV